MYNFYIMTASINEQTNICFYRSPKSILLGDGEMVKNYF